MTCLLAIAAATLLRAVAVAAAIARATVVRLRLVAQAIAGIATSELCRSVSAILNLLTAHVASVAKWAEPNFVITARPSSGVQPVRPWPDQFFGRKWFWPGHFLADYEFFYFLPGHFFG